MKKTLTQVVLPIAGLIGLVFGITYITNYSANTPINKGGTGNLVSSHESLKFPILVAGPNPNVYFMKYRKTSYEVEEPGHHDFWFRNVKDQNVRIAFTGASCTCVGADLGIIPPDAWSNFLSQSCIAGVPGLVGSPLVSALSAVMLQSKIEWQPLAAAGMKKEAAVPAASEQNGPQMGIVRVNWKGKEGAKGISAHIVAQLPNTTANAIDLETKYNVVPPYDIFVSGNRNPELRLGELHPFSSVQREFICWSRTRPELNIIVSANDLNEMKDCIEWTQPERLSDEESKILSAKLAEGPDHPVLVSSAYRVKLQVYERREVVKNGDKILRQLDLGPIDFVLKTIMGEGQPVSVRVVGVVRGDVRLREEDNDRIDFGTAFPSSESKAKTVTLTSQKQGLDIELIKKDCTPDYLGVTLTPGSEIEGRKQWQLRVSIPADTLSGSLSDGRIVLRIKDQDASTRKIRIPVKAATFETGGPRI